MESLITMDAINDKPNKINSLTKREVERQLNLQKKKGDKELLSADNEKLDFFETLFAEKQSYIESLIFNSKNIQNKKLPSHFDTISKEILMLQKYVAASNIFLRNYDLQRCQNTLQELTTKAKVLENALLPKKKFSFKNKIKDKDSNKGYKESNDEVDSTTKSCYSVINSCGFFDKKNGVFFMTDSEIYKKDVAIEKMESCTVLLKGSPSTLHLNYLKNCQIFAGPVSTSIFAENCENCILVIACQQLRLHSSKAVCIYLHVTSRAIMEDCKDIEVAPYNWTYEGIEKDFENSSLDSTVNNWFSIDDFNWLSEKHSPNWKQIAEKDRVKKWNLE